MVLTRGGRGSKILIIYQTSYVHAPLEDHQMDERINFEIIQCYTISSTPVCKVKVVIATLYIFRGCHVGLMQIYPTNHNDDSKQ